ncbi:MAG: undecaprenyl-diphosphate phosphatase [Bryobacterales bacterium]|nr:undecaprenyl-diphosphate phosphatase [Bryobacterales bacterium]
MPIYQVVILGLVQGLTEFLPISSSAHLALAPWLFGWKDPGLSFDIALHFGTLISVLLYFYKDWIQIAAAGVGIRWGSDPELQKTPKLLWMLAVGSLPIGFFGFLFEKHAETTLRNPYIIGSMLILVGVVMWIGESIGARRKQVGQISWLDSLVIGAAQALAIVPGTSRSGVTITAGLFRNIDRAAAARFSFLLSTPAIAAAAAKAFHGLIKHGGIAPDMRVAFVVGMLVSGISGCLVIAFFLRFLRSHSLKFFVHYRLVFGIIVIALAAFFRAQAG